MDFAAEEGTYQHFFSGKYFIDLNKNQMKCVNALLKESTICDPTDGGRKKVDISMANRLLILKKKDGKKLHIEILIKDDREIEYLRFTVPEKEKEKLDQLVRTLENELQAKEKKKGK